MIEFNKYFTKWLYEDDGYYSNYKQIGKNGDFYTSVSTTKFFGGSIAKKIIKSIESSFLHEDTTILEIGAHQGYLLADIIQFIYTLKPQLLDTLNFAIVEKYDNLQKRQKEYIKKSFGDIIKLKHYRSIKELKLDSCFIVANELFDAFSCDLVYTNKNNTLQIAKVKNHNIIFEACKNETIVKHCKKYSITKGEVALSYKNFTSLICQNIKKFEFLCFDYGDRYPRNDFSIRVYSKHKTYPLFSDSLNLEKLYKKSDITYDVHFNHLIDCFNCCKNIEIKFDTQLKSLIDFGIIELLELLKINVDEKTYLKELQKVKLLLEPTGMGDRFKALIVKKY